MPAFVATIVTVEFALTTDGAVYSPLEVMLPIPLGEAFQVAASGCPFKFKENCCCCEGFKMMPAGWTSCAPTV